MGREDVEDALSRLDALTNEAGLLFARTMTSDNTDKRVKHYLKSAANGVFLDGGNDVRAREDITVILCQCESPNLNARTHSM